MNTDAVVTVSATQPSPRRYPIVSRSRGLIRIPAWISRATVPVARPEVRMRPKRRQQDHQHEDESPPTCSVSTHEREAPIVERKNPRTHLVDKGPGSPVRSDARRSQGAGNAALRNLQKPGSSSKSEAPWKPLGQQLFAIPGHIASART